tara:strand:- start:37 stop:753 length:717 start_codon:yes stop_codon:yes gene_type:complete
MLELFTNVFDALQSIIMMMIPIFIFSPTLRNYVLNLSGYIQKHEDSVKPPPQQKQKQTPNTPRENIEIQAQQQLNNSDGDGNDNGNNSDDDVDVSVDGGPIKTDWIRDLLPEEEEASFLRDISLLHKNELPAGDLESFEDKTVEKIIATFRDKLAGQSERALSLLYLSKIVESAMGSNSSLNRVKKHENQVQLLNVFIKEDGLQALHEVQGKFTDQRYKTLASHALAKIASKIYEGWN